METGGNEKNVSHERADLEPVHRECIWSKAGVVEFRLCDNNYDCYTCPFDQQLRVAMGASAGPEAERASLPLRAALIRNPGLHRPCRHRLTGRVDAPKICTNSYQCYRCSYDQMLDSADITEEAEPPRYTTASGFRLADGYYYHLGHSWVHIEYGGRARVGADDFIARVFGPPQVVGLPHLGAELQQGGLAWHFSRGKRRADVLCPVAGTVLAVNYRVLERPSLLLESPYEHGWLFVLEPALLKENLKGLYFGKESRLWMEKEVNRLMALLRQQCEPMDVPKPDAVYDLLGNYPELGWNQVVRNFLRTGVV